MGRDLANASPEAMKLWEIAEEASGAPLRDVYWSDDPEKVALQSRTELLQPAMTAVNLSLWAAFGRRINPDALAGHSLGELSALGASGALAPETVVKLAALRGKLMSEADPAGVGGMAAVVKAPRSGVESAVEEIARSTGLLLVVANYNSPAQFVVSGDKTALDALAPLVKELKGKMIRLAVSGAFHSPLVSGAANTLAEHIDGLDFAPAAIPVYSNVDAKPHTHPDELKSLLTSQMTSSVRWIEIMKSLAAQSIHRFVELGPKTVLTKLVPQNLDGLDCAFEHFAVGSLAAGEESLR